MELSTKPYRALLSEILSSDPDAISRHTDQRWAQLSKLINADVLAEARSNGARFPKLLGEFSMVSRPVKTIERTRQKGTGTRPDVAFKVNTDLAAFRINTSVHEVSDTVKQIHDSVREHGGVSVSRNPIVDSNGVQTDIVDFLYVYLPSVEYLIEVQVGHPLAAYTFTQDSLLREAKNQRVEDRSLTDLWECTPDADWTQCFYIQARNLLLQDEPVDVRALWSQFYGDRLLPVELVNCF
jgi:hypothetical protein